MTNEQPSAARFVSKLPVSGTVVSVRAVMAKADWEVFSWKSYSHWVHKPIVVGPKYHRLSVQIRTSEGWILWGYIGKATSPEALPAIRVGDRIEIEALRLCTSARHRGLFTTSKVHRTLSGRVLRGAN